MIVGMRKVSAASREKLKMSYELFSLHKVSVLDLHKSELVEQESLLIKIIEMKKLVSLIQEICRPA